MEKIVKEGSGELTEKTVKETTEEIAETSVKETGKQLFGDWTQKALDLTGMIPGFGELSSTINALTYLVKGNFFDASVSAMSMVPIVGGLGAAAMPALKTIKELFENATTKSAKEATGNIAEKLGKEAGEGLAEKTAKESVEAVSEKTAKETGEELRENIIEETAEAATEKASKEVSEEFTEIVADSSATKVARDIEAPDSPVPTKKPSNTLTEETLKDVGEQAKEEKHANSLKEQYGERATNVINAVGPAKAEILLKSLDETSLDHAIQQGPDAVEALSLWSEKDLQEHGATLALRAKKDAQVLADVKKLVASGPIDPKNLTDEQKALIDAIAANSTQNADSTHVVLGKWVDLANGFVERAQEAGAVHYNPHSEMWNMLGSLENRDEVAWLINQQVVQTAIDKGLPVEYTLNGVPTDTIENEDAAIQAVFSGKLDEEIIKKLKSDYMPIRMKELKELNDAGYKFSFDEARNSYIMTLTHEGRA
jgi:hypothetical protein